LVHSANPLPLLLLSPTLPIPLRVLLLQEVYRFARCQRALPISLLEAKGVPLPAEEVEVLEDNLRWDELVVSGAYFLLAVFSAHNDCYQYAID
jgi:hypothetical protein